MGATNSRASPEPERTVVTLPEENPEIEPLAGASERQGATIALPFIARFRRGFQRFFRMDCSFRCTT